MDKEEWLEAMAERLSDFIERVSNSIDEFVGNRGHQPIYNKLGSHDGLNEEAVVEEKTAEYGVYPDKKVLGEKNPMVEFTYGSYPKNEIANELNPMRKQLNATRSVAHENHALIADQKKKDGPTPIV